MKKLNQLCVKIWLWRRQLKAGFEKILVSISHHAKFGDPMTSGLKVRLEPLLPLPFFRKMHWSNSPCKIGLYFVCLITCWISTSIFLRARVVSIYQKTDLSVFIRNLLAVEATFSILLSRNFQNFLQVIFYTQYFAFLCSIAHVHSCI